MSSRGINEIPIQPAVLPIRKYCGRADSRTPHQFVREFEMSSLCTGVNHTDIRNFYTVLGDQVSFHAPALTSCTSSFNLLKTHFFDITWTDADKEKELDAIKKEKFDSNGAESWKEYIFRIYLRIWDYDVCDVNKTDFCTIMNEKLRQVRKSDSLIFQELVNEERSHPRAVKSTKIYVTYVDIYGKTVKEVFHHDLKELSRILYHLPDDESKNQSKSKPVSIEKEKLSEVDRQPDSELESQPKKIPEIRPSDPERVILQGQKQEVISRRRGSQGSFLTPFLLSVFYFILYVLVLHFWFFEDNFDTPIMKPQN